VPDGTDRKIGTDQSVQCYAEIRMVMDNIVQSHGPDVAWPAFGRFMRDEYPKWKLPEEAAKTGRASLYERLLRACGCQ
jgi:hypothetical protein